jgi:plasmid maintenance system antidote protein VapI
MPETTTRGAELLREWLKRERRTQEWLGEQIGTHQTNISAWLRGRAMPLDMAVALRNATSIEVETWLQPPANSSPDLGADESGEHPALPVAPSRTG